MAVWKEIEKQFLLEYLNRDDEKNWWVHLIRVQELKTKHMLSGEGALANYFLNPLELLCWMIP